MDINNKRRLRWRIINADIIMYMVYLIIYITIAYFHEPWFDEAQAWQIAKCATIKEILFEVPHYEGHPPLWHLILMVPAKFGVPFELGLKGTGFIIFGISVYLLFYKAPFNKVIRYTLPLNFFIFYQYGVIVRPYGLMVLEIILIAIYFPKRNEKPLNFIISIIFLCMTHAYGIVISGGIAIAYVIELLQEKGIPKFIKELLKDKRERYLLILLGIAILLIIEILPRDDTYIASVGATNPIWKSLICMLFVALPDSLFTHSSCFWKDASVLQNTKFSLIEVIPIAIIGIMLLITIYFLSSKRSFLYFIFPYIMFALFGSLVYMTTHHIGVMLMLCIFWMWIECEQHPTQFILPEKLKNAMQNSKKISASIKIMTAICFVIPMYWNIISSANDISGTYSYGKELAKFLKSTELAEKVIFEPWYVYEIPNQKEKEDNHIENDEPKFYVLPAGDSDVMAYFDDNIIANNVYAESGQYYRHFQIKQEEELKKTLKEWSKEKVPEVLMGSMPLNDIFGNSISIFDYTPVFRKELNKYFKDVVYKETGLVYVRNDIMEELNLTSVDTSSMLLPYYELSEEMREKYKKGELTVEEIVDKTLGNIGIEDG